MTFGKTAESLASVWQPAHIKQSATTTQCHRVTCKLNSRDAWLYVSAGKIMTQTSGNKCSKIMKWHRSIISRHHLGSEWTSVNRCWIDRRFSLRYDQQKSDHMGLCSMFVVAGSSVSPGVHAGLFIPVGMNHVSVVLLPVPVMAAGSCVRESGLCSVLRSTSRWAVVLCDAFLCHPSCLCYSFMLFPCSSAAGSTPCIAGEEKKTLLFVPLALLFLFRPAALELSCALVPSL